MLIVCRTQSIDRSSQSEVDKNRSILSKIIDSLKFCVSHKLGIRGQDEWGDFGARGVSPGCIEPFF